MGEKETASHLEFPCLQEGVEAIAQFTFEAKDIDELGLEKVSLTLHPLPIACDPHAGSALRTVLGKKKRTHQVDEIFKNRNNHPRAHAYAPQCTAI